MLNETVLLQVTSGNAGGVFAFVHALGRNNAEAAILPKAKKIESVFFIYLINKGLKLIQESAGMNTNGIR